MSSDTRFAQVQQAAADGADWAWAQLYREIAPGLLRFLRARGVPDPEDALGETFVHLVRGMARFTGDEAAFRAWAYTVARSRAVDAHRRSGRRPVRSADDLAGLADVVEHQPGADTGLLEREAVRALLDRLTADQRDVVVLRVLQQFSLAETARIMGKADGAVKLLQHRALLRLRRYLTTDAAVDQRPLGRTTSTSSGEPSHPG